MVGSKKSIATNIKQSQPNCLLIHCYCHARNLAVGDAIKHVPVLKESLEDAYKLTKRQAAPQMKQEELKIDNLHLTVNTTEQMERANYWTIRLLCPQYRQLEQKHSTPSTITTNQFKNDWLGVRIAKIIRIIQFYAWA